jgi:hexosaminidase
VIDSIVPRPSAVTPLDGAFSIAASTVISFAGPDIAHQIARSLQASLRRATGFELKLTAPAATASGVISLHVDAALPAEGYRLRVTEAGIEIAGGSGPGLFYGTQTLLQLLPPAILRRAVVHGVDWTVPGVLINDAPRFGWRGLLLDTSRHFFGRDEVLKLIDALALHRMNILHLHLTDDQGWRMEIRRYPRLTEIGGRRRRSALGRHESTSGNGPSDIELGTGRPMRYDEAPHAGFYSQDDLREIVAYAAARFITVIPEIDLPGHSQAAIAAYPELGNTDEPLDVWTRWGINPHVLNVQDDTIRFYQDVLDEVLDVFPSEFIHIGGDECPKDEWCDSPSAQARMTELGLKSEDELQSWVIGQMTSYLAARGRRAVGWDEILEGGLPAGAMVMSWRGEEGGVAAAEAGHDVVMAPESHTYLYRHQSEDDSVEPMGAPPLLNLQTVYEYDPMPLGLSHGARKHVLGAQCQMWTEFVMTPRQMQQKVFPRMCAFAEAVWCTERDSYDEFAQRLPGHIERLRALDLNVFQPLN